MNIEQAREKIRSLRYREANSPSPSSNILCEEMPSFEQFIRERHSNRVPASKIKTLVGVKKKSLPQELAKVNRIAQYGYSRLVLAEMYGADGEVYCKRWLKEVLGWSVLDEITQISAQHPWLCGKADGRLSLGGEELLVEIKTTIHLSGTFHFPLEDLPQLQANMVCAGVNKTIYIRWNRCLCCAWLVEFDPRYWEYLLPRIRLRMSSPASNAADNKEMRESFFSESRFSGPPRRLIFVARRQGIEWHDLSYKPSDEGNRRSLNGGS